MNPVAIGVAVQVLGELSKMIFQQRNIAASIDANVEITTRNIELEHCRIELAAYQADLDREIHAQRIALAGEELAFRRERLVAEHDLVTHVLNMEKHAFDRKLDAFILSFNRAASFVESTISSINSELAALEKRRYLSSLTAREKSYVTFAIHSLRIERHKLQSDFNVVRLDFETNVKSLSFSVSPRLTNRTISD